MPKGKGDSTISVPFKWNGEDHKVLFRYGTHRLRMQNVDMYIGPIGITLLHMGCDVQKLSPITTANFTGTGKALDRPGISVKIGGNALMFSVRPENAGRERAYTFRVLLPHDKPLEQWLKEAQDSAKVVGPFLYPNHRKVTGVNTKGESPLGGMIMKSEEREDDLTAHSALQAPDLRLATAGDLEGLSTREGVVVLEASGPVKMAASPEVAQRHELISYALCASTDDGQYVSGKEIVEYVQEHLPSATQEEILDDLAGMASSSPKEVEAYYQESDRGLGQYYRLSGQGGLERASKQEAAVLAAIARHGGMLSHENRERVRAECPMNKSSFDAALHGARKKAFLNATEQGDELTVARVIIYPWHPPTNGRTIVLASPPEDILPSAASVPQQLPPAVTEEVPTPEALPDPPLPPQKADPEGQPKAQTSAYDMALELARIFLERSGAFRELPEQVEANRLAMEQSTARAQQYGAKIAELEDALYQLRAALEEVMAGQERLHAEKAGLDSRLSNPTPEQAKEAANYQLYQRQVQIASELAE